MRRLRGPGRRLLLSADSIRKIGSVGKPIPTIAARVVDERMNDVAPGQVGEIVYRGPSLMAGYGNNPAATSYPVTPRARCSSTSCAPDTAIPSAEGRDAQNGGSSV